jgi:hypothetical protein
MPARGRCGATHDVMVREISLGEVEAPASLRG